MGTGILPHTHAAALDSLPSPIKDVDDLTPELSLAPSYICANVGDMLLVVEEYVPTEQELTNQKPFAYSCFQLPLLDRVSALGEKKKSPDN